LPLIVGGLLTFLFHMHIPKNLIFLLGYTYSKFDLLTLSLVPFSHCLKQKREREDWFYLIFNVNPFFDKSEVSLTHMAQA
jgi:hypothetical protein